MPECTPQKGNLVFRGEDFKVRRMRNSVQGIPFGFRLIRAGEQITHRADLLDARQTGILTFTRETDRYLVGRTVEVRGVRVIDLRANFTKAKPS